MISLFTIKFKHAFQKFFVMYILQRKKKIIIIYTIQNICAHFFVTLMFL